MDDRSIEYIGSTDYKKLEDKLKQLSSVLDDLSSKSTASRKLRYAEVDIEAEREAGRLQPDELYVPQHIIDTNIRREQSPYVQYITQSPRAVICKDKVDPTIDLSLLEQDLTSKLRYDAWQLDMFSNIDAFQANGYGIIEVVQDIDNPGGVGCEAVQYGDFAFISDTKDLQAVEMTGRTYYYTKTRLISLCSDGSDPTTHFDREQVDKVINKDPASRDIESSDAKDVSLYIIQKNMFRVNGVVQVAWSCPDTCDDWIRKPRPLFIGRRKITPPVSKVHAIISAVKQQINPNGLPPSEEVYETKYPYILYPYLISENNTIAHLKGRIFLDQDLQEAVSSLVSSTVTQARRSAGLYFSKDVSDPNDDLLLQKNIFFKSGCLINSKVTQFQLSAPDPSMFSAINMLITGNQNETSQINFAVNNRKDSRKTAEEIRTATSQSQILSTVQVVLFSIALSQTYRLMVDVIKSRVQCGLITVNQSVRPLYDRDFVVKPSGDIDVIEKQQLIQQMINSWPLVAQTPVAQVYLQDLLEMMFPERAAKYVQAFVQAQQQQQSQQTQMMQQGLSMVKQLADGITYLSKHRSFFSDEGQLHAFPVIEKASQEIAEIQKVLGVK